MYARNKCTCVTLGVAGLILAVFLSCFGLNQQGSKRTRGYRKTDTHLVVLVNASRSLVTLPPRNVDPAGLPCELTESEVRLSANSTAPHKGDINFTWQVPIGRLIGEGREVTWDLSDVQEGTYTATVEASDRHKHTGSGSVTVIVVICPGWHPPPPPCPTVSVSCPSSVESKTSITFEATVAGGPSEIIPTYKWSLSAGKIISGQGTRKITIDVPGISDESVTATVSVGGFHPACVGTIASCTILQLGETKLPSYSCISSNPSVLVR